MFVHSGATQREHLTATGRMLGLDMKTKNTLIRTVGKGKMQELRGTVELKRGMKRNENTKSEREGDQRDVLVRTCKTDIQPLTAVCIAKE